MLLISHSKNIIVDFDAHHLTFDLVWVNFLSQTSGDRIFS